MYDVVKLEEKLKDNYELILKVLLELGFNEETIKYRESQHLITSCRPEEGADNPNGCLIYTNSLNVLYTTRAWSGNLFSLIMKIKEVNFPRALELIQDWIGIRVDNIDVEVPFGGFYKRLIKKDNQSECLNLIVHQSSELPSDKSLSKKFSADGVAASIQEKWGIRYDHNENAILIPIYDYSGNLVGCKARNNDDQCDPTQRFWAYIPYSKTSVVYGWYQNYNKIAEKQTVIVVESEKGVLQAASFGCEIVVGIGGHNISSIQAKYIKMLGTKRVIIAFDEGISEEEIQSECKKLQNKYIRNEVSYISDRNNIVIPKGSKGSPVDFGAEGFKKLYKNCRYRCVS